MHNCIQSEVLYVNKETIPDVEVTKNGKQMVNYK